MTNFSELQISPYIKQQLALARFETATPVQAAAIPPAVEGKDLVATAQTGTGKTLAFLIPILERLLKQQRAGVTALVLVPTRELAIQVADQYNALRGKQLQAAALVVGGLPEAKQLAAIRKGARLMVATPGRLEDFLTRRLLDLRGVGVLVLDEADRMLDMGFLPAIRRITAALPAERQTMCFSATLEKSVAKLVTESVRNPVRLALDSILKPSENVHLRAFEVAADRKQDLLCDLLRQQAGPCLVFARTKRGTERLAKNLARDGYAATRIHGDRSQSQRSAALAAFQRGDYQVLVATDVAARGIHVQGIAQVINYDLPDSAENFIHRVGRTGRAGIAGLASTLVASEQWAEFLQLERTLGIQIEKVRDSRGRSVKPSIKNEPVRDRPRATRAGSWRRSDERREDSFQASRPTLVALPGEVLRANPSL